MEALIELLKQRRIWVASIPIAVMISNALGIPLTEDLLTTTGDQVMTGVMALLALISYFKPKN